MANLKKRELFQAHRKAEDEEKSNRKRWWALCAGVYVVAQIFFLINVEQPATQNFDEFHYVPSAKQFLELRENQNYEHPPLAKELMAVGIGLFGDNPFGWRIMSTIFGALTAVAMLLWGRALFRSERSALWVVGITLANQLLYVQARIGMLDTFMFAFIAFGMAFFTEAWSEQMDPRRVRYWMRLAGVMFGLATACKWFGIIPWFSCLGLIIFVKLLQSWDVRFGRPLPEDWYSPSLFPGLKVRHWVLELLALPLFVYFLTFIPFFFLHTGGANSLLDLLRMQARMWDGQSRVVNSHPYMSNWPDWPLLKRPIWYAFNQEPPDRKFVRGVILLGNPLVMWSGMIAILGCAWSVITERRRDAFLILMAWGALYLSWAVIPRKVAFYYYYYPAGMVLSLALAFLFERAEATDARPGSVWTKQAAWVLLLAAALIGVRGSIVTTDPTIMGAGAVGVLAFLASLIFGKRLQVLLALAAWAGFDLIWGSLFMNYGTDPYFYPICMMVCLASAYLCDRLEAAGYRPNTSWVGQLRWLYLAAAVALFIWFFPILSALRIPSERFRQWMWFSSWI